MLALTLVSLFVFQDPADVGKDQNGSSQKSSTSSSLETWDDKLARDKVKAFEKALTPRKGEQPSMAERKAALDTLVGGKSARLVDPLREFIETDHSVVLKRQAVEMLAKQPQREAKKAVLALLKNGKVCANPQVQAGLVRALGETGYEAKDWKSIDDVFEADYDTERVPVHEAILDLIVEHKEVQGVPLLLRNFDEPTPGNVDAGDNPPAEYWKARWHSWSAWKGKVKEALRALTGQEFANAAEAAAWIKSHGVEQADGDGKGERRRGRGRRR